MEEKKKKAFVKLLLLHFMISWTNMKLIIFWKAGKKAGLWQPIPIYFILNKSFFVDQALIWQVLLFEMAWFSVLLSCLFTVLLLFIHLFIWMGLYFFMHFFFLLLNPLLNSYATILLLSAILVNQLCLTWLCLVYFSMSFSQNFAFLSEVCEEDSWFYPILKLNLESQKGCPGKKNLIDLSYQEIKGHHHSVLVLPMIYNCLLKSLNNPVY